METTILQSKQCPLCNKHASPQMAYQKGYWYCKDCALGWIKRIPKVTYEEEYYTSGSSILKQLYNPIEHTFYKIRNNYASVKKPAIWIDVGAGDGNYLENVLAKKKIGVEISASGRKTMKNKGIQVLTNSQFLKTKKLHADVISFWQVVEHVTSPAIYIQAAEKNLKKNGKLIIAVPNAASWELQFFGKYWFHLAPLYHIWHFSPKSMTKLLKQNNLKIETIDYWAVEHHLTGTLQTFINRTTKSEDLLHKLIRRRQNLKNLTFDQKVWISFWCTLGLPAVVIFWTFSSLTKRPGTFVIVASKQKKGN